jgi:hypothetical protein
MSEGPVADRRSAETLSFEVGGDRALVAQFIREITKHFGSPAAILIRPAKVSGGRPEKHPVGGRRRDDDQPAP